MFPSPGPPAMDADLHVVSGELPQSTEYGNLADVLSRENLIQPAVCAICHSSVENGNQEPSNICGDCKFLLIEDFQNPIGESRDRFRRGSRISRRRTRYSSSESTESRFSRQFSQMLNLIRQNQSTAYMHEENFSDGESSARLLQRTSTYTTPTGSRRWRHAVSDAESDGYDNMDSTYVESDTSVGFGRFRVVHAESDGVSFSAYGWDSDASIDGRNSIMDAEVLFQPDEASNLDSDTDIDPMHAGINHWSLDDREEDEGEQEEDSSEEDEWEETDAEEDIPESAEGHGQIRFSVNSSPAEGSGSPDWSHLIVFPREGLTRGRMRRSRRVDLHDILANLDESQLPSDVGHSGDYLDARSFEELLDYLADNENSRRGAPPAAVSFVNSLPLIVIDEDNLKNDDTACAICKDILTVGTEANQLPCRHLYHPSCILPWLNTRNSCPLCRYELPTDDGDYEEAKQNISRSRQIDDSSRWTGAIDDNSSDGAEADEERELNQSILEQVDVSEGYPRVNDSDGEAGRGRWLVLAAAPIISLVGVALVLWLGNPLAQRRRATNNHNFTEGHLRQVPGFGAPASNRSDRTNRRWWFPF